MANDISKVIPTIFAQGLAVLRNQCIMTQAINKSYSTDAREKGNTINIPYASSVAVTDVVPGAYANDPGAIAPKTAQITLDQWKEAAFTMTEKEFADAINGIAPLQLKAAAASLAEYVNSVIMSKYKGVAGYVGTAGTTPFSTIADATNARKILGIQKAPDNGERFMVINPDAEAQALALPGFNAWYSSGDQSVMREGQLGRKLGFNWQMDQQVPTHTSTPLTAGAATINGAHAAGVTTVSIAKATNAAPLVQGDIITFAGDPTTYVVTSGVTLAVGNTNVGIFPELKVAQAGGAAMTLAASHVVNLAFHKDAFGFASRPLAETSMKLGNDGSVMEYSVPDPVSGLVLRLTVRQEHHRVRWAFDILFGCALVRPELATRVAG